MLVLACLATFGCLEENKSWTDGWDDKNGRKRYRHAGYIYLSIDLFWHLCWHPLGRVFFQQLAAVSSVFGSFEHWSGAVHVQSLLQILLVDPFRTAPMCFRDKTLGSTSGGSFFFFKF